MDLEYVLGVISDGPTKSFAFRRLNYLANKFQMYSLLNEFQELADMKVNNTLDFQVSDTYQRFWIIFSVSLIGKRRRISKVDEHF